MVDILYCIGVNTEEAAKAVIETSKSWNDTPLNPIKEEVQRLTKNLGAGIAAAGIALGAGNILAETNFLLWVSWSYYWDFSWFLYATYVDFICQNRRTGYFG
jgi:hypothetical protein